ncbi:VanZ family protein [Streptomyces sp. NPDC006333]|uniref:VanZ family protein n=1 Tax=Streptomyces sp. NPDC006333 TaxID=3156753 RepID=UPI0033A17627
MNVALFVPFGFFGIRAARRPLPPVLLSVLLAAGIETVQACLPSIGRYCDTSDFVTNATGALAGVGVGLLSLSLGASGLSPWPARHRGLLAAYGAGFAAVACVLSTVVDVRVVDHAEPSRPASAEQQAIITRAIREALGNDVGIGPITDNPPCGDDAVNEEVWAELQPRGVAFMRWPDPDGVYVDVAIGAGTRASAIGRRIPGASGPVRDKAAAERAAGLYAAAHYPNADRKRPSAERADDGMGGTWTVTYSYRDDRMPAVTSLAVKVNSAARLVGVGLTAPTAAGRAGKDTSCV